MSRYIPSSLQSHLNETVHTVCYAMKVTPVGANAPAEFGVVGLDYSIDYDDGSSTGLIEYSNRAGFVPSAIKTSSDLGVDNAEAQLLIPLFDVGPMTIALIEAGRYQYAEFIVYMLNYNDLSVGNQVIELHGTIGRITVKNGLVCFPELRGVSQRFRQSVCDVDSITCRRIFGDSICGVDVAPLYQTQPVINVGVEFDRTFTLDFITTPSQGFAPGMCEFVTGPNMGREFEIEAYVVGDSDVTFTLTHATDYPISEGDVAKVRPDCKKRFREDCITVYSNGLQFDGEPDIPVGDEGSSSTPGASVGPGAGFTPAPVGVYTEEM